MSVACTRLMTSAKTATGMYMWSANNLVKILADLWYFPNYDGILSSTELE